VKKKKQIGYTTGVFDMFHIGHLNLLNKARERCDWLIVGVCTDDLVRELKNRNAIIPFEERIEIVKNISCVDQVVPQENIDEIGDFHRLHFNIMFKGDDWKGSEKWNSLEKKFGLLGVEVVYFDYTKHISSTKLREILELIELG